MKFNQNTPRNNPRLIITVNADNSASVKGCYIDNRENVSSFTRGFNDENQAVDYLNNMRDNGAEFSIQINRVNWKG